MKILVALAALLAATPAFAASLTNGLLFRADAAGGNITVGTGTLLRGGWTTQYAQQNVSGNYGANLFLTKAASPAPADFISPSASLSSTLSLGANTFYFYANGDDTAGGADTFGLNLFLDGASTATPSLSVYVPVGAGQTFLADGSPNTAGWAFNAIAGSGTLSFVDGPLTITLTDYEVTANGGANGGSAVDLVSSSNSVPVGLPPTPDGITDTYGHFTLTVTAVPEPASLAAAALPALALLSRKRKHA